MESDSMAVRVLTNEISPWEDAFVFLSFLVVSLLLGQYSNTFQSQTWPAGSRFQNSG